MGQDYSDQMVNKHNQLLCFHNKNQRANGAEAHATFRESHYQTASTQCMPIHDIYYSLTFDPSNALHSGQGFFPPNLVAIGHF